MKAFLRDYWLESAIIMVVALQVVFMVGLSDEAVRLVTTIKDKQASIQAYSFWFLLVSLVLQIILSVLKLRKSARITYLVGIAEEKVQQDALLRQNIQILLDGYLVGVGQTLELMEGAHDRFTLYTFDDEKFKKRGRYSTNPEYNRDDAKELGREGAVYRIWEDGWLFDNDFPDPSDVRKYKTAQRRYGLSEEILNALRMKARMYAGIRINGRNHVPVAVLLVESTEKDRYNEGVLKERLEKEHHFLENIIESMRPHFEDLGLDQGFLR